MARFLLHGGKGPWGDKADEAQEKLEKIADKVEEKKSSSPAIEIVEFAVNLMENKEIFNAGKGAKMQIDGEIRLDACLMTSDLDAGSVIGLEGEFKHPISVAKKVMEETHHVALKGDQAKNFAEEFGFETEDLRTDFRQKKFEETAKEVEGLDFKSKVEKLKQINQSGTVGAVAVDSEGNLAAATSTGGVYGQLPGRVGDSPIPGCGTHCNSNAAASATGVGEAIIKTTLTRRCTRNIEEGMKPSKSTEEAINFLEEKTGEEAGLITIDENGEFGFSFNSKELVWTKR